MPRRAPFAYPPYVRDRILARVAAGELVRAVCGEAGMPCAESVTGWARRDPEGFGAAYARAKAQGAWRRGVQFDAARAARLVERLFEGETLARVLADPAMPSWRVFRYWRATDLEFGEALARVNAAKREDRATRLKRRRRAYDARLADRILYLVGQGTPLRRALAADPALPCLAVVARWRREAPGFDRDLKVCMRASRFQRGARRMWSPELQEEILARLCEGASFREIARDPAMPCATTLSNWMRRRPGFAERVRQVAEFRDEILHDRMLDIAMATTAASVAADRRRIGALAARAGRLRRMWAEEEDNDDLPPPSRRDGGRGTAR